MDAEEDKDTDTYYKQIDHNGIPIYLLLQQSFLLLLLFPSQASRTSNNNNNKKYQYRFVPQNRLYTM